MTFYYQTAPLPTRLAWYLHHLPAGWHHLESWGTLALELVVPLAFFGPRRARLAAAALLTGFQGANLLTANYGFFVYLSAALHLFLLDEADVTRLASRARRLLPARVTAPSTSPVSPPPPTAPPPARWQKGLLGASVLLYAGLSLVEALFHFTEPGAVLGRIEPLRERYEPWRAVNTYHLFGHITRERVELELEVSPDGERFSPLALRYKPGPPERPPPLVAPHQPRVDFQLWFYELSFRRGAPEYMVRLVERLCRDPGAVAPLFVDPPGRPRAVRLVFYEYRFTTASERRASGAWWSRREVARSEAQQCRE
jgi:hypothetical protein